MMDEEGLLLSTVQTWKIDAQDEGSRMEGGKKIQSEWGCYRGCVPCQNGSYCDGDECEGIHCELSLVLLVWLLGGKREKRVVLSTEILPYQVNSTPMLAFRYQPTNILHYHSLRPLLLTKLLRMYKKLHLLWLVI